MALIKLEDADGKPVALLLDKSGKLDDTAVLVYHDEYYAYNWTSNTFRLVEPPVKIDEEQFEVHKA